MNSYDASLINCFYHIIVIDDNKITELVNILIREKSSFAITMDGYNGKYRLWLSENSLNILRKMEQNA